LFIYLIAESWSYTSSTIEPASYLAPYFDMDVHRNITVTIGQTAFIHCRVERLGDKDVSTKLNFCLIFDYNFDFLATSPPSGIYY
jgi:hypothetical protein